MTINKDTYALVTGASSGIGYAYAKALAGRGYNLLMVSNEEEALEEKGQCIREKHSECGINVITRMQNLGRQESAKELYDWCKENGLQVDVLINNAGVYHDRDFLDDSAAFTELILNLHIHTPSMLCYYFGKDMAARGYGYILNMSSVSSNFGFQRLSTYSSTKGFLRILSRALHVELKGKGVRVCCIRPGAVATPLYNLDEKSQKLGLALGVICTPEHLARIALKALFKGKSEITPGFYTHLLDALSHLPTWLLRLIRRRGWF